MKGVGKSVPTHQKTSLPQRNHQLDFFSASVAKTRTAVPATSTVPSNEPVYWTVSELTHQIKNLLEPRFTGVWVQGEISNYKFHHKGHLYFTLKDVHSSVSVALFGWKPRLGQTDPRTKKFAPCFDMEEGQQIVCYGDVRLYAPRGSYQIVAKYVEPVGVGTYQIALEQIRKKLMQEGLFDPQFKKPLPKYPETLAVITAADGAALQDVLQVLRRRAPHVQIRVINTLVQGIHAEGQLISALKRANLQRLGDAILLVRGGGSLEDLWVFNSENLARQIFASKIPVLCGVGHEVDTTIADAVSDLRAPTPSAAAEIISSGWVEASLKVDGYVAALQRRYEKVFLNKVLFLAQLERQLENPKQWIEHQLKRWDSLERELKQGIRSILRSKSLTWTSAAGRLDALSPLKILERGYAIVRRKIKSQDRDQGEVIRKVSQVKAGEEFEVIFSDGKSTFQAV